MKREQMQDRITTETPVSKNEVADGLIADQILNQEPAALETAPSVEEPKVNVQDELEKLRAQLAALLAKSVPANQRASRVTVGRKYVRISDIMETWGKVPQQQADLAAILTAAMEVNKEYTEEEVFGFVTAAAAKFPSISKSRQNPTYLFRYYRGLKHDMHHAGFVARNFIRQID